MNRSVLRSVSTLALAAFVCGAALAAPPKKAAKPAAMTCSVCKMPLSAKKTAANPVPVKINGKTYYCCSKCDMKAHKGAAKGKM